jgi:hypothetical protein
MNIVPPGVAGRGHSFAHRFGLNMRHNTLALMLVSFLFPAIAGAAPAPAPCSFIDQGTLAALDLGNADTKVEQKTMAATAQAPAQRADMCTFTQRAGASPSLSVMVITLYPTTRPAPPACTDHASKGVAMASCFGIARDKMVSVSLVSPVATFAARNATLRSRFRQLIDGAAGAEARANATR